MTHQQEQETPLFAQRMDVVRHVISVPKEEIDRREKEYQQQRKLRKKRRALSRNI